MISPAKSLLTILFVAFACAAACSVAAAEPTWSGQEQPVPTGSSWPVGLGNVGDMEFWAPNRGLLITEGHTPTIPPGLWAYNGSEWHEYATVCGASQNPGAANSGGRIAWAGPGEFWTVSDGRKGQANESTGTNQEREPPLQDNTLCHFVGGQVVGSYAHLAFQADSYQAMHAAACLSPADCWFAGDPLPEPQVGAFHLHWNGSALEEQPYVGEGHAVEDMTALEGRLYESVQLARSDRTTNESTEPPIVHNAEVGRAFGPEANPIPMYAPGEPPLALGALHFSIGDGGLWAAAGDDGAFSGTPGDVTVLHRVHGIWSQLIGPGEPLSETPANPLPPILPESPAEERELLGGEAKNAAVRAIAAEPGTNNAWLALAPSVESGSSAPRRAVLVHVNAEGAVLGTVTLPSQSEQQAGIGPKGAVSRLTCPLAGDCWLATTQGWLFHLAPEGERQLTRDNRESEYFNGLITFRPVDQGLPQVVPDAPPEDTSGLREETPAYGSFAETATAATKEKTHVPLLSKVSSRLVHGTTLQLRFHLAVKARVRLLAKRKKKVVAQTATRTLAAGNRKLQLTLNRSAWPTKLDLQTHALAPLPTVESTGAPGSGSVGTNTEATPFVVLPHVSPFAGELP